MQLSRSARIALRVAAGVGFAFIYVPLALVLVNSFNPDRSASWPPSGLTFRWWSVAWENEGARAALWVSVKAGLGATAIALVLGTLIAFAVARHRFFGRDAISFVVVLPIALPGIVTGIALNSAFSTVLEPLGVGLGLFTVIVGHATFCIVVVFNNVVARLRRTSGSYEEAAMDLGADTFRAFVDVTFPLVRSALLAGGLLAFALSFDEIVVTTFTAGPGIETLPIWIFNNMTRPQQAPVVNVVAAVLVLLSVLPIYAAQRLSADTASGSRV
ncbi:MULTISPECIES: ABC transporter permease [Streptomyces]|uniref:ABC transporter permease n=1 Tax=Streptomyces mirabilis TaxID=68239 RepID=A0ABU3UFM3_9ACTN|nr:MULTISPECIES: ABC transporter permease [Streptomyces]KAF5993320.1 spermidine/putrescine ABC transporter permease [Streptomyces sp. WAC00263]MCX4419831.1 ABC transporter permease [Streptomyces mirabilis]MCX4613584.1 ABC transporter permease [Streptomyces mirabilis]MDU8992713.1 ABC transporter permease [Streptomyces mirabilis]NMI62367.1 ABC transporter permease [Streptomyces sp. RLA2-12]